MNETLDQVACNRFTQMTKLRKKPETATSRIKEKHLILYLSNGYNFIRYMWKHCLTISILTASTVYGSKMETNEINELFKLAKKAWKLLWKMNFLNEEKKYSRWLT